MDEGAGSAGTGTCALDVAGDATLTGTDRVLTGLPDDLAITWVGKEDLRLAEVA